MTIFTAGDGCTLFYRVAGTPGAPWLIVSHALGTSHALFSAHVETLAESYQVLIYDMRCHGASGVPPGPTSIDRLGRDVMELMDHLHIDTADFLGVSLGGMIGQWAGARCGERFGKLVLANTSAYMGPPSAWDARITEVMASGIETIVGQALQRWFTSAFQAEYPAAIEPVKAMLRATDARGYAACCAAIRDMDLRPMLGAIRAPTLVLYGENDPATPPAHAHLIADHIPGSQRIALPGAHLCNIETPSIFLDAVQRFLRAP